MQKKLNGGWRMKKVLLASLATGLLMVGVVGVAQAQLFDFSYQNGDISGNGRIDTFSLGSGNYGVINGSTTFTFHSEVVTLALVSNPNFPGTNDVPIIAVSYTHLR